MTDHPGSEGGFDWRRRWADRVVDVDTALERIRPGSRIFIGSGCAEPLFLIHRLAARTDHLRDTEMLHILTMSVSPLVDGRYADHFRLNAFFVGANVREAVWSGGADYTPIFLSELPRLFRSGFTRLDAALIQVTPPDEFGYVSLGISVDVSKAAAESADLVIAQVNRRMPRTMGDTFLPVERIHCLVERDEPLLEMPVTAPDEAASAIGRHLARLVPDGATIQVGIGQIPDAVLAQLGDHADLGVHTEMLSDGCMDLMRRGVITCRRKTLHPGKVIASFCMGSEALYRFVDNNPMFEFHPSEYTNDPFIISRNRNMIAINSALEVDLTGQVCSDSLGHRPYSGIGGQMDFMRGAARSEGGRPIIALPSTYETSDGVRRSRIVPVLSEGAGVVTTRGDVHYVVTEWGVASLHGRSIRERTLALIDVAHPDFRGRLLGEAKRLRYVYPDQRPPARVEYPADYERWETFDGGALRLLLRPVRAIDEAGVQRLFHALSAQSRHFRFFTARPGLPHREAQKIAAVDYRTEMGIVAVVPAEQTGGDERVVGCAQYMLDERADAAEIAFMVAEAYQNRGIGTVLIRHLAGIARENRISRFTADVLAMNGAMIRVLLKSGYEVKLTNEGDTLLVAMDLTVPAPKPADVAPETGSG